MSETASYVNIIMTNHFELTHKQTIPVEFTNKNQRTVELEPAKDKNIPKDS